MTGLWDTSGLQETARHSPVNVWSKYAQRKLSVLAMMLSLSVV